MKYNTKTYHEDTFLEYERAEYTITVTAHITKQGENITITNLEFNLIEDLGKHHICDNLYDCLYHMNESINFDIAKEYQAISQEIVKYLTSDPENFN